MFSTTKGVYYERDIQFQFSSQAGSPVPSLYQESSSPDHLNNQKFHGQYHG